MHTKNRKNSAVIIGYGSYSKTKICGTHIISDYVVNDINKGILCELNRSGVSVIKYALLFVLIF